MWGLQWSFDKIELKILFNNSYTLLLKFIKSNDFVDKIVRFLHNIIEREIFLFETIIICFSRKGMVICLLPQLN